jgi:hypothetical protein
MRGADKLDHAATAVSTEQKPNQDANRKKPSGSQTANHAPELAFLVGCG